MLLATCVNTPIDHNMFQNLRTPVARCSASCVNWASFLGGNFTSLKSCCTQSEQVAVAEGNFPRIIQTLLITQVACDPAKSASFVDRNPISGFPITSNSSYSSTLHLYHCGFDCLNFIVVLGWIVGIRNAGGSDSHLPMVIPRKRLKLVQFSLRMAIDDAGNSGQELPIPG